METRFAEEFIDKGAQYDDYSGFSIASLFETKSDAQKKEAEAQQIASTAQLNAAIAQSLNKDSGSGSILYIVAGVIGLIAIVGTVLLITKK